MIAHICEPSALFPLAPLRLAPAPATVQADKALCLLRLVYSALAEAERMLIGAGEVGQEACRALAEGIDKRRQEVTDVVCTGSTPGDDPTQAARFTEPRLAYGMTWWLECIAPFNFGAGFEEPWPLETMRARILAGPPRMQNLPGN